jgi:biotin transport system ATP-binding protein
MDELLRTEDLWHRFPDGKAGLAGVSLSIKKGDFLVLAGRNGSGKSLLVKHMIGLKEPSSGKVLFRGESVMKNLLKVRSSVGLVFQDAESQVIGQTVGEDVAFGPENLRLDRQEIDGRVKSSLTRVGMAGMEERQPDSLSGGEKRRLAIAGVLAMDAECLILDEPFANLDLDSIRMVMRTLRDLHSRGSTILLLTHELEKVLALATRLVVLQSGAIRFDGDPDDFPADGFERYGLADPYKASAKRSDLAWL